MKSKHPFEAFVPVNSTKLIIGTIPPQRFCTGQQKLFEDDVNFYYGSRDNYFWGIMGKIFDAKFDYQNTEKAVEQRKDLLRNLRIGITDIVDECIHIGGSAADKKLEITKCRDIKYLLQQNPSIYTIIYTSEFVKTLVNKQLGVYHSIDPNNKKRQTFKYENKIYQVRILYSPSPMALRRLGKGGVFKRIEQYRQVFSKE